MDYSSYENRFFEILLKYLPENKYIELEDYSIINLLKSTSVNVNYHPKQPIWFFRFQKEHDVTYYYFGLNDEKDIKLVLKLSEYKSKSFINFFASGKIAIKIQFTKDGKKIVDSMKRIFLIKHPDNDLFRYNYLMLLFEDISEVIPTITNLINIINFDYNYKKEFLVIKGFKENIYEGDIDDLVVSSKLQSIDSDKKFIEDEGESDNKGDNSQLYQYGMSVENIISEIDCSSFNFESSASVGLDQEFKEIVESPVLGLVSRGLNDEETSQLVIHIEKEISGEKISGDAMDIVEFYFEQYKSIKRQFSLNNFLDEFIKSDDFDNLRDMYDYSEDIVFGIINHVRSDISDEDILDNDKVILKVEYYFKAETNKNDYFNQIDKIKADSEYYKNEYNLTNDEFDEILDYVQTKISEGYHIKNVENCLINKIKEKVDANMDESRLKLNKTLNNQLFIEKNNITQEQLDKINEYVGDLIYRNKIRSDEIYEETLLTIRRGIYEL